MSNGFAERLEWILAGRVKNTWGKELGFNSANITRMFRGEIPGYELLGAIARKENLSLTWLLEGRGVPFLVDIQETAEGLLEKVDAHLEDGDWQRVYLTNAPHGVSIVLRQPGQYDYKGTLIDYQIIEVLTGPLSEPLIQKLKSLPAMGLALTISSTDAERIATGQVGTYLLFGDERKDGLLTHPDEMIREEHVDLWRFATDTRRPSDQLLVNTPLMRGVIELVEQVLIEEGLSLDPATRARVITSAYRSAEKKGRVDPLTVAAIIETVSD